MCAKGRRITAGVSWHLNTWLKCLPGVLSSYLAPFHYAHVAWQYRCRINLMSTITSHDINWEQGLTLATAWQSPFSPENIPEWFKRASQHPACFGERPHDRSERLIRENYVRKTVPELLDGYLQLWSNPKKKLNDNCLVCQPGCELCNRPFENVYTDTKMHLD